MMEMCCITLKPYGMSMIRNDVKYWCVFQCFSGILFWYKFTNKNVRNVWFMNNYKLCFITSFNVSLQVM